ncbi:MAG TPA: hypothetical protein VJ302_35270, partial [Blastocatellia bacterium]|nr:hypothetical protein [Blastocatellia bacterium]
MAGRLWRARSFHLYLRLMLLTLCALTPVSAQQHQKIVPKRPLTHRDYDRWRSIQGPQLSPDGRFLAYLLAPQDGDGEIVVRQLATGIEWRSGRGWCRPSAADPSQANSLAQIFITRDSRFAIFVIEPNKEDLTRPRGERRTVAEAPKTGLGIMDLSNGRVTRIDRVRSFQLPANGSGYLAYSLEPRPEDAGTDKRTESSPLILYHLANHTQRAFGNVLEYSLSQDARSLVFTVSSRTGETNGVYVITPGSDQAPAALLAGAGRYRGLTWDAGQTQLAFLSDRDEAGSERPRYKLYHWDRQAPRAAAIVSVETPGFRRGLMISDQAPLSFSSDGSRLFLGVSPPLKT